MTYKTKANIAYIASFILIAAYILCRLFLITTVTVSGPSMIPTFKSGDIIVCKKVYSANELKTDDIIVFKHDNSMLVKRIVAIPGEKAVASDIELSGIMSDYEYFVLGDNSSNSLDSRNFGSIKFDSIKYKYIGIKIHPILWYTCFAAIVGAMVITVIIFDKKAREEAAEKGLINFPDYINDAIEQ